MRAKKLIKKIKKLDGVIDVVRGNLTNNQLIVVFESKEWLKNEDRKMKKEAEEILNNLLKKQIKYLVTDKDVLNIDGCTFSKIINEYKI